VNPSSAFIWQFGLINKEKLMSFIHLLGARGLSPEFCQDLVVIEAAASNAKKEKSKLGIERQLAQLLNDIRSKPRGFSAMRYSF
jgi:hypothetical protein